MFDIITTILTVIVALSLVVALATLIIKFTLTKDYFVLTIFGFGIVVCRTTQAQMYLTQECDLPLRTTHILTPVGARLPI